jgi:hypothetical protein
VLVLAARHQHGFGRPEALLRPLDGAADQPSEYPFVLLTQLLRQGGVLEPMRFADGDIFGIPKLVWVHDEQQSTPNPVILALDDRAIVREQLQLVSRRKCGEVLPHSPRRELVRACGLLHETFSQDGSVVRLVGGD